MWALYVGLYKYDYYMKGFTKTHQADNYYFPYPQLMLFALASTLYAVPHYRWLLPTRRRRRRRRYTVLLALVAVVYLWWGIKLNAVLGRGLRARGGATCARRVLRQALPGQCDQPARAWVSVRNGEYSGLAIH